MLIAQSYGSMTDWGGAFQDYRLSGTFRFMNACWTVDNAAETVSLWMLMNGRPSSGRKLTQGGVAYGNLFIENPLHSRRLGESFPEVAMCLLPPDKMKNMGHLQISGVNGVING